MCLLAGCRLVVALRSSINAIGVGIPVGLAWAPQCILLLATACGSSMSAEAGLVEEYQDAIYCCNQLTSKFPINKACHPSETTSRLGMYLHSLSIIHAGLGRWGTRISSGLDSTGVKHTPPTHSFRFLPFITTSVKAYRPTLARASLTTMHAYHFCLLQQLPPK